MTEPCAAPGEMQESTAPRTKCLEEGCRSLLEASHPAAQLLSDFLRGLKGAGSVPCALLQQAARARCCRGTVKRKGQEKVLHRLVFKMKQHVRVPMK